MGKYELMFSELQVKGLRLRNRVVVPPMVQVRPIISAEGIAWYRRLAAGGAALVIVEATGVPRFGDDLTADSLRPLVDTIHKEGAAAAIQLFPLRFGRPMEVDEPTTQQVAQIVAQYGVAAEVCRDAGFDGVEPHGAHGFLLNRFFMPDQNHRTDQYGGSFENRSRLAKEIVARVRQTGGDGLLIFYRHTPAGTEYTLDDSLQLAQELIAAGVDVLDISPAKDVTIADRAAPFKARFKVPVIAVGGMNDPDQAEAALRDGKCDLVAVGRQMIADAGYPTKVRTGHLDDILECQQCDVGCFGNLREGKPVECVLWTDDQVPN